MCYLAVHGGGGGGHPVSVSGLACAWARLNRSFKRDGVAGQKCRPELVGACCLLLYAGCHPSRATSRSGERQGKVRARRRQSSADRGRDTASGPGRTLVVVGLLLLGQVARRRSLMSPVRGGRRARGGNGKRHGGRHARRSRGRLRPLLCGTPPGSTAGATVSQYYCTTEY